MIHKKLLSLLVLLMVAASSAWAQDVPSLGIRVKAWMTGDKFDIDDAWFYYDDQDDEKCVHFSGGEVFVPDFVYNSEDNQWSGDGDWIPYDKMLNNGSVQNSAGDENIYMTPPAGKSGTDHPLGVRVKGGKGTQAEPYQFELIYGDVIVYTDKAEGETTFTTASFDMPAYDATVEYEIVRDMTVDMAVTVQNGPSGIGFRLEKQGESYVLADNLTVDEVITYFTVHDGIENKDLSFYGEGAVCGIKIFAIDENEQATGEAIDFEDLEPGRYVAKAAAATGSDYDGMTAQSNVFDLFEGFDLSFDPASIENMTVEIDGEAVTLTDGKVEKVVPGSTVTLQEDEGYTFVGDVTVTKDEDPSVEVTEPTTDEPYWSFDMPNAPATVAFNLKRDLTVDVVTMLGENEDGQRFLVRKDGEGQYSFSPNEISEADFLNLLTAIDWLDDENPEVLTPGTDITWKVYTLNASGNVTGTPVNLDEFNYAPGRYAVSAVAAEGSDYANETMLTADFLLVNEIDLSEVEGDIELQNGDLLTGTFDGNLKPYRIIIPYGATITLSDANIIGVNDGTCNWAGITCIGDATIILEGENSVKGFYKTNPGIFVPENRTLTIKGDGSLDASSNGAAPGIGGGYNMNGGNIVIESGTIYAVGGAYSPGIGGGYDATIGDVTINEGANVTSTKGELGTNSIGTAYKGEGGIVKIGGVVKDAITADTYTYPVPSIELDEVDDNTEILDEWNGYALNVTLNRTLTADGWNTFALPFNVDATILNLLKLVKGVSVKELTDASYDGDVLTLNFEDAKSIEAGKPYMVKVTDDFDLSIQAFPEAVISNAITPVETSVLDFIPTLGKTTITGDPKSMLFLSAENKFQRPSTLPADFKGFRAYFMLKGQAAQARGFRMDFGDDEATGIISVEGEEQSAETAAEGWYTLEGIKLDGEPVEKGVYVKDGKKVIVK